MGRTDTVRITYDITNQEYTFDLADVIDIMEGLEEVEHELEILNIENPFEQL